MPSVSGGLILERGRVLARAGVRAGGRAPLARNAARWKDPVDYSVTQAFGRPAREAGIGLIRYDSVRDREAYEFDIRRWA